LTIQDWISQGSGSSKWHGSLSKVTDAPSSFNHSWDYENYDDLSDYYCDKDDEEDDWNPYNTDSLYSTLCDTFDYIGAGGTAFIVTSSICLLIWLIVTILMVSTFKGRPTRGCGFSIYGLSILICIVYIIGFAIWAGEAKINFSGDCDDIYDDDSYFGDQQDTCAESGTKFALATLILNIVYAPLFICLVRKRTNEMDIPYAPISNEIPNPYFAGGPPNTVYQGHPNQYYNPPPQQAQYASPSAPYYHPN
jgi:hypothetical protein